LPQAVSEVSVVESVVSTTAAEDSQSDVRPSGDFATIYDGDHSRIMGEGGFGRVFEVPLRSDPETTVAVKIVPTSRFDMNEWRMLKRLRHPNIMSVADAHLYVGPTFILRRRPGEKPLP
jgi:hypothetical protein